MNPAAAAMEEFEFGRRSVTNVFERLLPSFLLDFEEVPENGKENKISQIQYLENIIKPISISGIGIFKKYDFHAISCDSSLLF